MADNEVEGEISENESDISLHGESECECEGEDSGGEDVREQIAATAIDEGPVTPRKGKVKKKKKK